MGENGFRDLNPAKLFFTNPADHITSIDFDAIQELDVVVPSVDELDHKTVFVFLHAVGIIIEVESNPHRHCLFANARSTLKVKLNGSSRISF